MTTYAFQPAPGVWVEILGATVEIGENTRSQRWVETADPDERAAMGIVAVITSPAPALPGELTAVRGLVDVDGVPTRTWSTDHITVEALSAACVAAIKAEAGRRILGRYSQSQQQNMNMRATELVDTRFDRDLTEDEEAERVALKAAAAWIKSVRAASDDIEADLPSDLEGLIAFDITAGWPA